MISIEDIEIFLPKYLSSSSKKNLFDELKSFPYNIDNRLYTNDLIESDIVYQGDGFLDLLMINLPDTRIGNAKGIILSNTCDIDPSNDRFYPSRISYCPIFSLEKYEQSLIEEGIYNAEQVTDHILSIKKQYVSQIFYLPATGNLDKDSIVFFDAVLNCDNNIIDRSNLRAKRIFTLSDYGIYLFLFKLSFHFTRIQEGIERGHI